MKVLKIKYLIIALIITLSLLVSSCSLSTTDNSASPDPYPHSTLTGQRPP